MEDFILALTSSDWSNIKALAFWNIEFCMKFCANWWAYNLFCGQILILSNVYNNFELQHSMKYCRANSHVNVGVSVWRFGNITNSAFTIIFSEEYLHSFDYYPSLVQNVASSLCLINWAHHEGVWRNGRISPLFPLPSLSWLHAAASRGNNPRQIWAAGCVGLGAAVDATENIIFVFIAEIPEFRI